MRAVMGKLTISTAISTHDRDNAKFVMEGFQEIQLTEQCRNNVAEIDTVYAVMLLDFDRPESLD